MKNSYHRKAYCGLHPVAGRGGREPTVPAPPLAGRQTSTDNPLIAVCLCAVVIVVVSVGIGPLMSVSVLVLVSVSLPVSVSVSITVLVSRRCCYCIFAVAGLFSVSVSVTLW